MSHELKSVDRLGIAHRTGYHKVDISVRQNQLETASLLQVVRRHCRSCVVETRRQQRQPLHVVHEEVDVPAKAMLKSEHQDRAAADHHVGASEALFFEIGEDRDGRREYLLPAIARDDIGLAHDPVLCPREVARSRGATGKAITANAKQFQTSFMGLVSPAGLHPPGTDEIAQCGAGFQGRVQHGAFYVKIASTGVGRTSIIRLSIRWDRGLSEPAQRSGPPSPLAMRIAIEDESLNHFAGARHAWTLS